MKGLGGYSWVLENRLFYWFWLAKAISSLGAVFFRLTILITITEMTDSAMALGLVLGVQALPSLFMSPLAGVLVDRLNKKIVLIVLDILRASLMLLAIFIVNDLIPVIIIVAIMGVCTTVRQATDMAILPALVEQKDYMAATGLLRGTLQIMQLVGPGIAGILIDIFGLQTVFGVNSLAFLFSGLFLLFLPIFLEQDSRETFNLKKEITEGLVAIKGSRVLISMLALYCAVSIFAGGTGVLMVDYIQNILQASPYQLGVVQSVLALGAILANLVAGYFGNQAPRFHLLLGATFGIGIVNLIFFTDPGMIILGIWAFIIGACDGMNEAPFYSLIIDYSPDEVRGRIMSFVNALIRLTAIISLGLAGIFAGWFGSANVIGASGIILLLLGMVILMGDGRKVLSRKDEQLDSR
ncbi:MFS transporter [Natranaerobius thermophilus]|uniref:MFS transporter n=1 Tax=Natranaerobius thermophilus TaxID=375929 RepID=UPI00016663D4